MSLVLDTSPQDGTVIIRAEGDLDVYTAPRLKEALDEAVAGGRRMVVDLSEVHFIDSTALGVLVAAHREALSADSDMQLVVGDPFLLKIFHITGFDGIFTIVPQIADALSHD